MTQAEKKEALKKKADKLAVHDKAEAAIKEAKAKEAEAAAEAEAKAAAAAAKAAEAEAKNKHFISSIYLDDFGVCKVGDRCTSAHIKAMKKDEIPKHVG